MERRPPSGIITFVFTDIEGSTHLWDSRPQLMQPALVRHDTILRQEIAAEQGHVFKTIGDAFCAAFHSTIKAAKAACAIERRVASELSFPAPIRVRIAIHTGTADGRDGDYFGGDVNLAHRVVSRALGGEVLVTEPLVKAIKNSDVLNFETIGEVVLKGFPDPLSLYIARPAMD